MSKRQELEKEIDKETPTIDYVTRTALNDIFKSIAFPINKRKGPNTLAIGVEAKILHIETNAGKQIARKGDFVVKGIDNQYFAVPKEIFEKTYYRVKPTE